MVASDANHLSRLERAGMSSAVLEAALEYAKLGWPVFPCQPGNKRPFTAHGVKDASTDPDTIRGWWRKLPRAMIGMSTGKASGIAVVDVDIDEAKGKNGEASLAAVLNGTTLPEGMMTVRTPRGGRHLWFACPGDRESATPPAGSDPVSMSEAKAATLSCRPPSTTMARATSSSRGALSTRFPYRHGRR